MGRQTLKAARARVRETFGPEVAEKATKAFCSAYGRESPPALEAMGAAVSPLVRAVIELDPVDPPSPGLDEVVKRMRASGTWAGARSSGVDALGSKPDPSLAARTGALLHPTLVMREIYIREMRERCLLAMSPARVRLEQHAVTLLAPSPGDGGAVEVSAPLTQVCWLNQTIRALTTPETLEVAAAETSVRSIDVPRGLRGELTVTGEVVGAVQHRATTRRSGGAIVVAVIDGEVSLTHPALLGRVVHRRNFTSEPWGFAGLHGTAIAGIVAARGEFVGMAPDAVIFNYKVLPTNGTASASDFDLACALQQALEDGARVANCSLESSDTQPDGKSRLVRACDNAWALGMSIVKSAGNGGRGQNGKGTITCPGDARGVIVVGATGRTGQGVAPYSSEGPVKGKAVCPDLVAPGGVEGARVISCTPDDGFAGINPGTSLAAPHVSGLLALILEGRPDLTPDEQRALLLERCTDGVEGGEIREGKGLIHIALLD